MNVHNLLLWMCAALLATFAVDLGWFIGTHTVDSPFWLRFAAGMFIAFCGQRGMRERA